MGAFDDLPQTGQSADDPFSDLPDAPEPGGFLRRYVADPAISLLKGAIGVPETAVGLADLVTGGAAGKAAEDIGFRPKEAKATLDTLLSPEQQAVNKELRETKGFLPSVAKAVTNPSTIAHAALESLPVMGAGGVVARGLLKGAPKVAPLVAGGFGEGLVTAGQNAEQVRQLTPGGRLTPEQAILMAGSGVLTGVIGAAGGKLAQKLGIADIDTLLAGSTSQARKELLATGKKGIARRLVEGGLAEGVFEELPQSAQEQIAQNLAIGKPWNEGVPEAGAMGMLVGGLMGAGANVVSGQPAAVPTPVPPPPRPTEPPAATPHDAILRDVARKAEKVESEQAEPTSGAVTPDSTAPQVVGDTPATVTAPPTADGTPAQAKRELEALRAVLKGEEVAEEDGNFLYQLKLAKPQADGTLKILPAGRRRLKVLEGLPPETFSQGAIDEKAPEAQPQQASQPEAPVAAVAPPVQPAALSTTEAEIGNLSPVPAGEAPRPQKAVVEAGIAKNALQPQEGALAGFRPLVETLVNLRQTAKDKGSSAAPEIERAKAILSGRQPTSEDAKWFGNRARLHSTKADKRTSEALTAISEWIKKGQGQAVRTAKPRKHDTTTLFGAIKAIGGISSEEAVSVTGEKNPKNRKGYPVGIFSKSGKTLDEVARALAQDYGFRVDLESSEDNGGVNQVTAMLQEAARMAADKTGGTIYSMEREDTEASSASTKKYQDKVFPMAEEYGVETMDGNKPRPMDVVERELEAAIKREITAADESFKETRTWAISSGVSEIEISEIEDEIAQKFEGDTSQDMMVRMYNELEEAIRDHANEREESTGSSEDAVGDREAEVDQGAEKKPEAGPADQKPVLELTGQTPADLLAEETRKVAEATKEAALAMKAAADAMRESFTLTGSNRQTDQVAARGQQELEVAATPVIKDDNYYYVSGNLGMKSNGSFTAEKRHWMTFGIIDAQRMASANVRPYGATRTGEFVGTVSGNMLTTETAEVLADLKPESETGLAEEPKPSYTAKYEVRQDEGRTEVGREQTPEGELNLYAPAPIPGSPVQKLEKIVVEPQRVGKRKVAFRRIRGADEAASAFMHLTSLPMEKFQVLGLDEKYKPIAYFDLFAGTVTGTSVYPREVWTAIYQTPGIKHVWIAHQHPSGVAESSAADRNLTRVLKEALTPDIGVNLLGHLIITKNKVINIGPGGGERHPVTPKAGDPKHAVPIMERVITKQEDTGPALSSPNAARSFFRDFKPETTGLLVLDGQNNPTGWWPISTAEMSKLRTGDAKTGMGGLMEKVGRWNAVSVMAYSPNPRDLKFDFAVRNTGTALALADVKMLDAITIEEDGSSLSFGERGFMLKSDGGTFLSRGKSTGIPIQEAQAEADRISAAWKNAPKIIITESTEDWPFKAPNDSRGAFHKGKGYLASNNLGRTGQGKPQFVIFHEALGHYGLQGMFGKELAPVLSKVWLANKNVRTETAKWIKANRDWIAENKLTDQQARLRGIEEALSNMAGRGETFSGIKKIMAAIQSWLRDHGFQEVANWLEGLTDAEALFVLTQAREFVTDGSTQDSFTQQPASLSRGTKTDSPEFRKWFGESKVVDADGNPLAVYHGTGTDFTAFSHESAYSGEGASQTGSGFYFTDNHESASRYAELAAAKGQPGMVMPVYLSIKNPLFIDFSSGETSGADITLSRKQVREIILGRPNIRSTSESPLLNFDDIAYEGFEKVLNQAIKSYAGSSNIAALRNDFFGNDHAAWLKALSLATGHDGAYTKTFNGDTHWVAWQPEQIKSTNNRGTFDPNDPNILLSRKTAWYYSELARSIEASPMKQGTAKAWQDYIKSRIGKGVKPEEIEATGINDWLAVQEGKVTKEQASAFMEQGGVQVTETMLGKPGADAQVYEDAIKAIKRNDNLGYDFATEAAHDVAIEGNDWRNVWPDVDAEDIPIIQRFIDAQNEQDLARFSEYQLPGSVPGSYRELVLTLPSKSTATDRKLIDFQEREFDAEQRGDFDEARVVNAQARELARGRTITDNPDFQSSHFPGAGNYLAHVRVNDRVLPDGRKVLMIEELQSDRGAAVRKSQKAIQSAVDNDFEGIVKRMEKAGVLEVNCD